MTRREALFVLGTGALGGATTRLGAWSRESRIASGQAARATFAPDIDIELAATQTDVSILPGPRTKVWSFRGRVVKGPAASLRPVADSYLGPTITVRRGQKIRIRFSNRLPDPSIVHWHGLDVPESADGHPRLAVPGGAEYVYEFEVTNRAGTYWYHPHPHMQTGPQVYSGLAGLFIVTDDDEAALRLPDGGAELPCVIQDRRFDGGNQLVYSTAMMDMETGFLGDRILINGQLRPEWRLGTRAYRLRVLNGSNARIYKLAWSDGTPMTVIGTDGGLLQQPHAQRYVTLAPAQRADVWIDLSRRTVGSTLELRTEAFDLSDAGIDMGAGMGRMMGRGMAAGRGAAMSGAAPLPLGAPATLCSIVVARRESAAEALPERFGAFDRSWQPDASAELRRIPLTFQAMAWGLGGRTFEMEGVTPDETVRAGSTHVWEFVNGAGPMGQQMAHPIHLHGRQFRVVGRSGGAATNTLREGLVDSGWMDTVLVLPGETVRVQVTVGRHPGLFLYHCHILEHEDMGMMRNFRILA